MNGLPWLAPAVCSFLLTYLVHSTVIVVGLAVLIRTISAFQRPTLRVMVWKSALLLPVLTAACVTLFPFPHFGFQVALSHPDTLPVTERSWCCCAACF